jgi:hypothetical protein
MNKGLKEGAQVDYLPLLLVLFQYILHTLLKSKISFFFWK